MGGGWGCRVAGSRNEICVTRGPTSPRLAPPLLSSVQPDAVPVSAPGRVAARYIIQLCHSSYTGTMAGLDGEGEQRGEEAIPS